MTQQARRAGDYPSRQDALARAYAEGARLTDTAHVYMPVGDRFLKREIYDVGNGYHLEQQGRIVERPNHPTQAILPNGMVDDAIENPACPPGCVPSPGPATKRGGPAADDAALLQACREAARRMDLGGLFDVPAAVRSSGVPVERAHESLIRLHRAGKIELRPYSGLKGLTPEERKLSPPGPQGSVLSVGRLIGWENAKENPIEDPAVPWVKVTRDPERYAAALELAKAVGPIENSQSVYNLLGPALAKEDQEVFLVVLMDVRRQLRGVAEVARGQRSTVTVGIADVMRVVIASGAETFVVCHNHPSSKADPSDADIALTADIAKAFKPLEGEVTFADHVVIGMGEYYSFADHEGVGSKAQTGRRKRK